MAMAELNDLPPLVVTHSRSIPAAEQLALSRRQRIGLAISGLACAGAAFATYQYFPHAKQDQPNQAIAFNSAYGAALGIGSLGLELVAVRGRNFTFLSDPQYSLGLES